MCETDRRVRDQPNGCGYVMFSTEEWELIEELVCEYEKGADGYDAKLTRSILLKIDAELNHG